MRDWKPGDLAMVTIGGIESVALRDRVGWITAPRDKHSDNLQTCESVDYPTRPLVVIDPESDEEARHLAWLMQMEIDAIPNNHSNYADELTAAGKRALRSLVEPPRAAEPRGIGGVVHHDGSHWVGLGAHRWLEIPEDRLVEVRRRMWDEFPASVQVVREGIEPLAEWERDLLNGSTP